MSGLVIDSAKIEKAMGKEAFSFNVPVQKFLATDVKSNEDGSYTFSHTMQPPYKVGDVVHFQEYWLFTGLDVIYLDAQYHPHHGTWELPQAMPEWAARLKGEVTSIHPIQDKNLLAWCINFKPVPLVQLNLFKSILDTPLPEPVCTVCGNQKIGQLRYKPHCHCGAKWVEPKTVFQMAMIGEQTTYTEFKPYSPHYQAELHKQTLKEHYTDFKTYFAYRLSRFKTLDYTATYTMTFQQPTIKAK